MVRIISLLLLLIAAVACSRFDAVGPARETLGRYSVDPQIQWNAFKASGRIVWTVNGVSLDRVVFISGAEDGEALFTLKGVDEMPPYRAGSDAFAVAELVATSLEQGLLEQVSTSQLTPIDFGGRTGFSFRISGLTKSGLKFSGHAAGSNADGLLDMLLFLAPDTHYFGEYLAAVAQMVLSVRYGG